MREKDEGVSEFVRKRRREGGSKRERKRERERKEGEREREQERAREKRGGGLGSSTVFKNLMSPTPRRKWYLTTGRRAH